jgi:hypothetical protein
MTGGFIKKYCGDGTVSIIPAEVLEEFTLVDVVKHHQKCPSCILLAMLSGTIFLSAWGEQGTFLVGIRIGEDRLLTTNALFTEAVKQYAVETRLAAGLSEEHARAEVEGIYQEAKRFAKGKTN